jgi:hypothetical protein
MQILVLSGAALGALVVASVASHWQGAATMQLPAAEVRYTCNTAALDDAFGPSSWSADRGCSEAPTPGLLKEIKALPGDMLDQMFGPRNAGPRLQIGAGQPA